MHNALKKIWNHAQRHDLFSAGPFTVGLSGGPDSVALLLAMIALEVPVSAVHFNHGLRGDESDADEMWCQDFCSENGVSLTVVPLHVPKRKRAGESVEMAARRLRVEHWSTIHGRVCLGHHLNDALETFLLRLCRGANASSLAGLRPVSIVSGTTFIRPLLCLSRQEVTDYLASRQIVPRHDSSNDDVDIQRNLVRKEIVPALTDLAGGPAALFKSLQFTGEDAACLDALAAQFNSMLTTTALREHPWPIAYRVVRDWFYSQDVTPPPRLTASCAERLRDALDTRQPILVDVDDNWFLRLGGDAEFRLVAKTDASRMDPIVWNWSEAPCLKVPGHWTLRHCTAEARCEDACIHEDFAPGSLPDTLIVRKRRPGDRLVPFGSRSPKSLKKLISDAKVPFDERDQLLVVTTEDDDIIWIPGVRRAEFGRVSETDASAVRICAEKLTPSH